MILDSKQIEGALSLLVGLQFCAPGHARTCRFDSGGTHTRVTQFGTHKGELVEVHDYSLHVQCSWRVPWSQRDRRGLEPPDRR